MTTPVRERALGWLTRLPLGPSVTGAVLVLAPLLMATDFALSVWLRFCIFLILLTGLNLINGLAGMISLAQAGFFGLGAYAAGVASTNWGVPTLVAFFLAPVVVTVVALVVGAASMRLRAIYFTMATLGIGYILYLLFGRATDLTGGPNGLVGVPPLSVLGFTFTAPIALYLLGAVCALLGAIVAHNITVSRTGRALRALGASEPAAVASGANAFKLRMFAFALSGFYAGVAGAIEVFDARFVSPSTFDFFTAVLLLVALVIGGPGTALGPLFGAALLTALEVFAADFADYEPLITGLAFLLAIQLFPKGVAGEWASRQTQRRFAARRTAHADLDGRGEEDVLHVSQDQGNRPVGE
ncbi:MAG TPA: branched-chain amino acid ABC transporter permease [Nocardioidaceae bacterium]|nr:branched-chain amino acid ABC transporter permease [Nocardioidaceae bacterium]